MLGSFLERLRRPSMPQQSVRSVFRSGDAIAFVTMIPALCRVSPEQKYFSAIASIRLRVIIPAVELARYAQVWLVPIEMFVGDPGLDRLGPLGALVIGKLPVPNVTGREASLRKLLQRMEAGGLAAPAYADLSDDYAALARALGEPFLAEYQRRLGASCVFTVPCQALAESVSRDARRSVIVVEDPYESSEARAARVVPSDPLRLLWFGNLGEVNAPQLEQALVEIAGGLPDSRLHFEVVADGSQQERVRAMAERLHSTRGGVQLAFTPWSLEATEAALERSDFVLLPQEHRTHWGRVKSHNRLVSAIRAGRFAVASPIPAYEELADYAWVGEDLAAGLRWALAHPEEAARRVSAGQLHIEQRFSPGAIGRRWAAVLGVE